MRWVVRVFGLEVFAVEADDDPAACDCEDEYTDAGTTGAYPIGFAPTPHPGWERPLNTFDEPGEGDEDV